MAEVLERQETLYDLDLLAWVERETAHLRAGQLDRLDVEHLIDELEAMAGNLRRELKSRLRILLAHLLKWQFQPRRRSRGWAATIAEQRVQIEDLLEENPSLRRELDATARAAYPQALRLASIEAGLPRETFPADLPYDLSQVLGDKGEVLREVSARSPGRACGSAAAHRARAGLAVRRMVKLAREFSAM